MTYLIIGNGEAGDLIAKKLREYDNESDIIIATKESYPFDRKLCFSYIEKDGNQNFLKKHKKNYYSKNRIELKLGYETDKYVFEENYTQFKNGERIYYDYQFIATGLEYSFPLIEGISDIYNISNLEEVNKLSNSIVPLENSVVIGGGLIGVMLACAISKRGARVTLIEKKDTLISNVLDKNQSDSLVELLGRMNINVLINSTVVEGEKDSMKITTSISNDKKIIKEIEYKKCILAYGLNEKSSMFDKIGIEGKYKSKYDNVYLLGDVAHQGSYDIYDCDLIKRSVDKVIANLFEDIDCNFAKQKTVKIWNDDIPLFYYKDETFIHDEKTQVIVMKPKAEYKKLVIQDGYLKEILIIGDKKKNKLAINAIDEMKQLGDFDIRELLV